MSFSYSGDPSSSPLDALRFILGDTKSTMAILQDEEINWIVNNYTTGTQQLAVAFRQCATIFGGRVAKRKLGPQEEDSSLRLKYFKEQADKYERMLVTAGVPPLPVYQFDKVFEKGMMGNV